jgi:nickel-dependent lactate racemase
MIYFQTGSPTASLSHDDLKEGLYAALTLLGKKKKILAIPPDFTRFSSRAGELTRYVWNFYGDKLTDILPALGTHSPMTDHQITEMFGDVPKTLFRVHDWRNDVVSLGEVPAEYVREVSENAVDFAWPAQVNKLLVEGGFDLILSIGQVVPHEVVGMANYNKNIFVGTGGAEGINKSHFIGAAFGMEKMMGRSKTPVRKIFDYASHNFAKHLPILYILTVIGMDNDNGCLKVRGLYVGDDKEVFKAAAALSLEVNFNLLDRPMNPSEFKSTWLGNKSIYRTRMAIADGGELIVLAPALKEFGEDAEIDRLIRKYGYIGTPNTLRAVRENEDLKNNLGAAAHLIHGSSEGRFSVTYCPGGDKENLTRQEIESVGFHYASLEEMSGIYDPAKLKDGWNTSGDGEEFYYISNPALGLWAVRERFNR